MKLLCSLSLLWLVTTLYANPIVAKYKIQGQVVAESNDKPLEYATISAYGKDSLLIDGTITDANGNFALDLEQGDYRLRIEFIGFLGKDIPVSLTQNMTLDPIKLAVDGVVLESVEVTGEKSQMVLQLDKKVFNVGKDMLSQGGTANEILDNVPSISVEASGAVSLRGNSGVKILINGRPSSLADNNALGSIPASSIEKVEVITNPSARYEAAGNAGIINIVLKADKTKGFNGSITAETGIPANHRTTFNFNFRREKLNFFGNVGARYSNYKGRGEFFRQNFLEGVPATIDYDHDQDRNDKSAYGFVGLEYFLTPEQTLTASYSNYSVVNTDQTRTAYIYKNQDGSLAQDWKQTLDYREPESYHQIDLVYSKTFDKEKNQKWNLIAQHDFWFNDETENIVIDEFFPLEEQRLKLHTNTIESSKDYLLQTDYESKLGENGNFELGLRGETRVIKSDFVAQQEILGEWQTYQGLDNRLDYYERIGAVYVQYGQKFGKLSYLLGLRTEYTYVKIDLENELEDEAKDYVKLFPTFNVSYEFSEATALQLSYSKRIRRPRFWQLNPFRGLNDPNQIFRGNPDLDPAYTDRFEINMVQTWEKLSFNPAIYFSNTTDFFGFYLTQEADGLVVTSPINLKSRQNYGLEITTSYRPVKGLRINGEINWFGYQENGQFLDNNFDYQSDTWRGRLSVQYRFLKSFSVQGRLNYSSPYRSANEIDKAVYYADFALGKTFLDDKLSITVNLRNAFDSRWYRSTSMRPTFIHESRTAWNVRRFGVSATYRFQQGERLPERRARGSIR